ncbi:transducin/WD40 repeat-like superfamily protein [Striga asiatica]|uniref:Transducin/WD40 repeat-like superfamily protein n=1 Tax=Striga asiatica TaxID=4170 RepID=A0A5A7Q573_STRAF|nr:transducin/WD40 repeat-like superfamily protein [Striga asiatica]
MLVRFADLIDGEKSHTFESLLSTIFVNWDVLCVDIYMKSAAAELWFFLKIALGEKKTTFSDAIANEPLIAWSRFLRFAPSSGKIDYCRRFLSSSVAWSVLCNVESELLNRWLEPLDFRLWDARTGTIVGTLEAKSSLTSAEFDPQTREVHIHLATVVPKEPHAASIAWTDSVTEKQSLDSLGTEIERLELEKNFEP